MTDDGHAYQDPTVPTEERVEDLLARMTTEEKVAQLGSIAPSDLFYDDADPRDDRGASDDADTGDDGDVPDDAEGQFDRERAEDLLGDGIGEFTRVAGEGGLLPRAAAETVNESQAILAETRLGIPAIPHEECLSGYMGPGGTTYPQGIGLASTWDPSLVEKITTEIRRQLLAIGVRHALSPVLDLARDLRWGRTEETFGEDPYLVARMGCAYVEGLQGDDPAAGVAATVKHFVGHGAPRGGKNRASVSMGTRDFHEHLFPFEAAVREADVEAVMNAYHDVDGVPVAASRALLTDLLREEWGFSGLVVADYGSVKNLRREHEMAADDREAALDAIRAGIDVELPGLSAYEELVDATGDGELDEAVLDRSVRRVLRTKFRKGLFEADPVDPDATADAFETDEQRALARRAARESVTLLENEADALPIASHEGIDLAAIGPKADATEGLLGDYAYLAHFPELQDEDAGIDLVSPLAGIENRLGEDAVTHEPGCTLTGPETDGIDDAVATAADADVAVAFVGGNSTVDHSDTDEDKRLQPSVSTSGEGRDATDLGLPGVQEELLAAVRETDTPLVVVLVSGKAHALGPVLDAADAVCHAWLPGEEGGNAIADVLFGDHNPSGRLPVTLPRSVGGLPVNYDRRPNDLRYDYVYEPAGPLFHFGHGKSYTDFEYGDLELAADDIGADGGLEASVTVENVGDRAGHEVVQWYTRDVHPPIARPDRKLRGFERVFLAPGEATRVTIETGATQLSFLGRDEERAVHPGEYELEVGRSAGDLRETASFEITGEKRPVGSGERRLFSDVGVESADD